MACIIANWFIYLTLPMHKIKIDYTIWITVLIYIQDKPIVSKSAIPIQLLHNNYSVCNIPSIENYYRRKIVTNILNFCPDTGTG